MNSEQCAQRPEKGQDEPVQVTGDGKELSVNVSLPANPLARPHVSAVSMMEVRNWLFEKDRPSGHARSDFEIAVRELYAFAKANGFK